LRSGHPNSLAAGGGAYPRPREGRPGSPRRLGRTAIAWCRSVTLGAVTKGTLAESLALAANRIGATTGSPRVRPQPYGLGVWPSVADLTALEQLLGELGVSQPVLRGRFESVIRMVATTGSARRSTGLPNLPRNMATRSSKPSSPRSRAATGAPPT
jgi:hypothetical protein